MTTQRLQIHFDVSAPVSEFGAGDRRNLPFWATGPAWKPKVYQVVSLSLAAIYGEGFAAMELITILNRCHHF